MEFLKSMFGSKPKVISRNPELKVWEVKKSGIKYSASIRGIKLELTSEADNRESSGSKTLLARHFLEKEKWQKIVVENFGEEIYKEIFETLSKIYEEYLSK